MEPTTHRAGPEWLVEVVAPSGDGWVVVDLRACAFLRYDGGIARFPCGGRLHEVPMAPSDAEALRTLWTKVRGDMERLP